MVSVKEGFSIYGNFPVGGDPVDSNIQEIQLVVGFCFCCELHVWVVCVEVLLYVVNVRIVGVVDYQNIIDVLEVADDFVFV